MVPTKPSRSPGRIKVNFEDMEKNREDELKKRAEEERKRQYDENRRSFRDAKRRSFAQQVGCGKILMNATFSNITKCLLFMFVIDVLLLLGKVVPNLVQSP